MRVVVLIDDGYEELETMGPIALLRRGGVDVDIVLKTMILKRRIV